MEAKTQHGRGLEECTKL